VGPLTFLGVGQAQGRSGTGSVRHRVGQAQGRSGTGSVKHHAQHDKGRAGSSHGPVCSVTSRSLARRQHQTRAPSGRSAVGRRADRQHVVAGSSKQPCDQRVGVPHVTGPELVPPPGQRRNRREDVEKIGNLGPVIAQALRAGHSLSQIRDTSIAPAANLVAEQPETAEPSRSDRSFADDPVIGGVDVPHRSHLDHEGVAPFAHFEGAVIEVINVAALAKSRRRFEETTIETHRPATGSKWQPEEINCGLEHLAGRRFLHGITQPHSS
jgi:hypothetical protein